ncbi:MFS transporter [Burkholderia cepacia]|uniref:MFS transporter n=1 Tax=Burkholderia cepacia TaxID=292 RepID=UPI000752210C|nr:MFS transporter [Burkholderia cepacia]KVL56369.1 MFS transporter [Burkholderia cepacia]
MNTVTRQPAAGDANGIGLTLAATSFGFVVVQLDVTIVNVAMPTIGAGYGTGVQGLQWIVDAYTLAFAALLLPAGTIGDRFGSRRVFSVGLVLFALASLACAAAPSIAALVLARAAQGIGAALILPASLSLLSHACAGDSEARAHAVGWWTAIGGVVSAIGPVVGGMLTSSLGWRWIFFVNLPICAIGLLTTRRHVAETIRLPAQRLDIGGQLLAIVALVFLTHAVIEAGVHGWLSAGVLSGFAVAAAAAAAFIANEARVAAPMIPLRLFRNRVLSVSVLLGIITNLTFYALIFVLSLYFQRAKGYTPTETGLALLPFTAIMLANLTSAHLARRFSRRTPIILGNVMSAVSFAWLHGVDDGTPYLHILPSLLLLALGTGMSTPAITSSILASVEPARAATASAIFSASRQIGSALGVALVGTLLAGEPTRIAADAAVSFDLSACLRLVSALLAALCL